jgi:3-phosphoglycerate kinase
LADVFVNDAFGSAHARHCSTAGVADFLPAVSGFLINRELEILGNILTNPARPFVAILGAERFRTKSAPLKACLTKPTRC